MKLPYLILPGSHFQSPWGMEQVYMTEVLCKKHTQRETSWKPSFHRVSGKASHEVGGGIVASQQSLPCTYEVYCLCNASEKSLYQLTPEGGRLIMIIILIIILLLPGF